jgi:chromate transport protein ChrA
VTEKFNFYDIYGFALPGFLLLAVLWLPFGLIEAKWPDAELSSALLGIIIAYIIGHVLQQVARQAMPSNFLGGRFPSTAILDEHNATFTGEFKRRLAKQIKDVFEIDVSYGSSDQVRNDAFFLCRSALIKSKTVAYAEQFEGLHALMRGLTAAFAIAVVYYLGWAYSGLLQPIKTFRFVPRAFGSFSSSGLVILAGIIIAIASFLIADRFKDFKDEKSRRIVKTSKSALRLSLLIAAFAAGYYLGLSSARLSEHRSQLIAAAVLSFFAAERCYAGYKVFGEEFAKAVYRDFSNYEKPAEEQRANPNPASVKIGSSHTSKADGE